MAVHKPSLVYDGVCNLCTGAVRFLNAIDQKHLIIYAPYQTLGPRERATYALSDADLQGRMHLIQNDGSLLKGAAAIAATCELLSPVVSICEFFKTPLAQRFYDFIARRRYRLFGCRGSCYVPKRDR